MKKAIIISICPERVASILNRFITMEIRKNYPRCEFPIGVFIYCKKGKKNTLHRDRKVHGTEPHDRFVIAPQDYEFWQDNYFCRKKYLGSGKVVAKFTLDDVYLSYLKYCEPNYENPHWKLIFHAGLATQKKAAEYLWKNKRKNVVYGIPFFAWHISDLEVFDEPKDLSEFGLKHAPQSWCYVEVEE